MGDYSRAHVCQCLSRLWGLRPTSTVTIYGERRKTGQQFVEGVLNLAHQLSKLGIVPGNVVAICAFNSDWYLEWMLAVAYLGGILAPVNYRWSFEESRVALEAVRPALIVTDDCCTWLSELQNSTMFSSRWHVTVDSLSLTSNRMENESYAKTCDIPYAKHLSIKYCWAPEDVAVVCFTSGTTGRPKGVTISHSALIVQSLAKIAVVGYTEDDVYLHTAPMCHIGGISSGLAMLMAGGCHVLIPKFEAKLAAQAIEENHVTSLITVPAIMADLISAVRYPKLYVLMPFRLKKSVECGQSLKKILNGGGSLSTQLIEDATKCFPRAKLFSAYGMTETCSSLTFITLCDPTNKNPDLHFEKTGGKLSSSVQPIGGICVGKPAPHVEMMIFREDFSLTGRIMTRGPHVMIRYWGQTSAEAVDSSEQWFDTGDIGQIDACGNLWLVGRRNGRIKSGGENVYPEEVEAILSQHPGISAVVIVGLPQLRLGEMVVACVRIRDSWIWDDTNGGETLGNSEWYLSSKVLKQYCRQKSLTGFKIPKTFVVWKKPFPLTSTGKLKREQVKRETMSMLQLHPLLSNL